MQKSDCRNGMTIIFGKPKGAKTLGKIVRCNPQKAKVLTMEARGTRDTAGGQEWGVPYSLIIREATPEEIEAGHAIETNADRVRQPATRGTSSKNPDEPMKYTMFEAENTCIMQAIVSCYIGLSPENLSCDGEASATHVRQRGGELRRKLDLLQQALGRPVSEMVAYDWDNQREAWEKKHGRSLR